MQWPPKAHPGPGRAVSAPSSRRPARDSSRRVSCASCSCRARSSARTSRSAWRSTRSTVIGGLGLRPPAPTVAYTAPAYVTASAFRDEAVTVDAGGWPLPGTLSLPAGDWTVSRRGARPWLGTKRSRRIDRAEQAVSRSGGGAGQPRDRGAAIRQADQDARRPGCPSPRLHRQRGSRSTMRSRR